MYNFDKERNSQLRLSQVLSGLSMIIIFLTFIMLGYVFYLLFWPVRVIEVKEPMRITKAEKTFKRAEIVEFEFDYCKYKDLTSNINISFTNHALIQAVAVYNRFKPGCHKEHLLVSVPLSAPAGKYRIQMRITYKVNPIRVEEYNFFSEDFVIEDEFNDATLNPTPTEEVQK